MISRWLVHCPLIIVLPSQKLELESATVGSIISDKMKEASIVKLIMLVNGLKKWREHGDIAGLSYSSFNVSYQRPCQHIFLFFLFLTISRGNTRSKTMSSFSLFPVSTLLLKETFVRHFRIAELAEKVHFYTSSGISKRITLYW